MVELIPSQDAVMQILTRTGAFREGHFIYPNGKHSPHYFQMPLAFRYYDTARVLAVALSRKFRLEKDISSQLPKVAVISPSSGGIPVAFGVRDALWAIKYDRFATIGQGGKVRPHGGQGHAHLPGDLQVQALAVFFQALQGFSHGGRSFKGVAILAVIGGQKPVPALTTSRIRCMDQD